MSTPLTPRQEETVNAIADHYKEIIKLLGEDPDREGLLKTPMRAARALFRVTRGYDESGQQVIEKAIFTHEGSRMVIVKDIEFYSFCEHHILPFFGHVSIGYIPDGKIVGLSKLARLVNVYARRLQVQERMTAEICRDLQRHLAPKGVIVVSTAQHLCMKLRGVEKQDSSTTTMETSGVFDDDYRLREEFLRSLAHN
ncbi:MAG: GTP cyclohydrolase I FolE [Candidatus Amulumruptor sp.]